MAALTLLLKLTWPATPAEEVQQSVDSRMRSTTSEVMKQKQSFLLIAWLLFLHST